MENQPIPVVEPARFDCDLVCVEDPFIPGDAPFLVADDAGTMFASSLRVIAVTVKNGDLY